MAQKTPAQKMVRFRQNQAQARRRKPDPARMKRERSSFSDVRAEAEEKDLLPSFDAAHERFGGLIGKATPLAGGIAWMTTMKPQKPMVKVSLMESRKGNALVIEVSEGRLLAALNLPHNIRYPNGLRFGGTGRSSGGWSRVLVSTPEQVEAVTEPFARAVDDHEREYWNAMDREAANVWDDEADFWQFL